MHLLVGAYEHMGRGESGENPSGAAVLLLRAAHVLSQDLDGIEAAFAIVQEAVALAPESTHALDELERLGEKAGLLDETQKHLGRLIERSLVQATALELIRRRACILKDKLRRFSDAADAYGQLSAVQPEDQMVLDAQRECLEQAGRHQDMLMLLERQLPRVDVKDRPPLLREMAHTWEQIDNRWEAMDCWKKVLALVPNDPDALEGVERLSAGTREMEFLPEASQTATAEVELPELSALTSAAEREDEDGQTDPGSEGDTAPEPALLNMPPKDTLETDLKEMGIPHRAAETTPDTHDTSPSSEGTTEIDLEDAEMVEGGTDPTNATREIDLEDVLVEDPDVQPDNTTREVDLEDVLVGAIETSANTEMIDLEEVIVRDEDSD